MWGCQCMCAVTYMEVRVLCFEVTFLLLLLCGFLGMYDKHSSAILLAWGSLLRISAVHFQFQCFCFFCQYDMISHKSLLSQTESTTATILSLQGWAWTPELRMRPYPFTDELLCQAFQRQAKLLIQFVLSNGFQHVPIPWPSNSSPNTDLCIVHTARRPRRNTYSRFKPNITTLDYRTRTLSTCYHASHCITVGLFNMGYY